MRSYQRVWALVPVVAAVCLLPGANWQDGPANEGEAAAKENNAAQPAPKASTADPFGAASTADPFGSASGSVPVGQQGDPFSAKLPAKTGSSSRSMKSEHSRNDVLSEKLELSYEQPEVVGVSLSDFMAGLGEIYDFPILIDGKALDEEGLDPDTEVNWSQTGVRLRTVLELVLDRVDLTYRIKDGILIVTTVTDAEEQQETRVYDCGGASSKLQLETSNSKMGITTSKHEQLISVLQTTVDPLSWESNGGPAGTVIASFGDKLVVRTTEKVHIKIRKLLKDLEVMP